MKGTLATAVLLLTAAAGLAQEAGPPASHPDAGAAGATGSITCPYCRGSHDSDDFCPRCGRLSGMESTAAERRFWGDAPYVLAFPPRESPPSIAAELSENGLVKETVTYLSGDRYTMTMGKRGPEVEGRVNYGRTAQESDLRAKISDSIEDGGLVAREIRGRISGDPDHYLYRKLDYVYSADGRLDAIRFGTWFYADESDRGKKPGAWLRHAMGEIVLVREESRLVRIETTYREGRRSLRGEPEYADPVVTVESVRRSASGAIDRLVPLAR